MFLNEQQVADLTHSNKKSYQIKWLRENGIIFRIGYDGKPIILSEYINKIMGGMDDKYARKKTKPDFSILQDRGRLKHVS